MPEISRFYGIVIRIFYEDHMPPHFHAEYGGKKAEVQIDPPNFRKGHLTPRAERMVIEWASKHRHELQEAWKKSAMNQNPGKISPLE